MLRAAGLGLTAGLRSMLPLAMLTTVAGPTTSALGPFARSGLVRRFLNAAAVGELIADKHPKMPSRLGLPSLAARIALGATAGAILGGMSRRRLAGSLVGAAAALVGSVAGFRARSLAGHRTRIADPVWGALEDAVALALGWMSARRPEPLRRHLEPDYSI